MSPQYVILLLTNLSKIFGLVEHADNVEGAESIRQRCNFDLIISAVNLPTVSVWTGLQGYVSVTVHLPLLSLTC